MQRRTLVIVIILLTVATRFYHLTYQSLWFDELYSVTIAAPDNSVQGILTDIKTDFHPPLFYFLLHYVFRVFPYNDLTGRLLSAIIGCIGVWLIYLLAKQSGRERFALLTALFCSVFFFHVKYSQEVRMYIVLFCLATITSLLFLKYLPAKETATCGYMQWGVQLCCIHTIMVSLLCLPRQFVYCTCLWLRRYRQPCSGISSLLSREQAFYTCPGFQ